MSTDLTRAEQRKELLRRRLADAELTRSGPPASEPGPAAGSAAGDRPLTPGQRRMWSIQQLDPTTVGYNVTIALDLTHTQGTDLDADRLGDALAWVVARHDILRTGYRLGADGTVRQEIHRHRPARFEHHDVAGADPAGAGERAGELAAKLYGEPFDLAEDSPLRVGLIRTGAGAATLVVVAHHIVWDDGTAAVFFGELLDRYRALTEGTASDASERAARQYLDVAEAAERLLTDADRGAGAEFWRSTLTPLPELLDLPGLSGASGSAGRERSAPMRPGSGGRVRELARREGASTFMVLFAAVSALLHRHTGAREFLIGAPVVNRDLAGGDEVIGYLGNTIALRAEVDGSDNFRDLVARSRSTCVAAYEHQHVELDDVAQLIDLRRLRGGAGLFNVVLSLRSPVLAPFRAAGLTPSRRRVPGSDARFDLTLAVETDGDELTVEANYPAGPSSDPAAELILTHLDRLLDAALTDPTTPIGELDLLGPGERDRLVGEWNDTGTRVAEQLTPELLAAAERRAPDSTALVVPAVGSTGAGAEVADRLTYAELHAAANRLARHLVAAGLGPGDTVALATPRTTHLMVSVLAVLAAGAAYVPVDPEYPRDRVEFMLTDSRPKWVLCTGACADALAVADAPLLVLDDPATETELATRSAQPLTDADRTVALRPEHPAYVIYTSGSTGRPKGVVVSHRALANHLHWSLERFVGLGGQTLMHSSMSFDFSVTPMLGTLLAGGALELCADSPDAIANSVSEATFLKITPSHLPLLDAVRFAPGRARTLVVAGEALNGEALAGWVPPADGTTDVINEYGPTETTVGCLLFDLPAGRTPSGPVPVGHPVTNTTCHVLDTSLRLVPVGVAGELYVGGTQVAEGYLGRPSLSASRFVADPFGSPGARLYRTGDRVRRREDGALEFLGRVDDQVKIRGFRVEPGEIEAALAALPEVAQAAVVARTDGPGGSYLAGYVVGRAGQEVDGRQLRERLARTLPDHMVPTVITVLPELPLSPSGKTDRRALPVPALASAEPEGRPPDGPVETVLDELFREVLGAERIGVTESFFERGGDSILAIQLVSKARKAGLRLTPRAVFEHRTVEALASAVAPDDEDTAAASSPADITTRETGPVPPSPIQRAFAERGPLGNGHRMSALLDTPPLRHTPLAAALGALLDTHAALRARLDRERGELEVRPRGTVTGDSVLIRVPRNRETPVGQAHADAVAQLDPAAGVMLRVVWFDAGPDRPGQLLLVAHHLVVDGVSLRLLAEDLAAAWQQAASGATPALAEVGTSVREWAQGLVARAPDRVGELDRWRSVLEGPEPTLGNRRFDPERDTWATGRTHTVELDEDTAAAVLNAVPTLYFAGVDDVLLAALGTAVVTWRRANREAAGADQVGILLEGHGRQESVVGGADLSRTVGWFTTQHPVRLDLSDLDVDDAHRGGSAAGTLVKRVKEHLRSLPDHGVGFGMLRRLHPESASALAEFEEPEIGFNYLGRFSAGTGDWTVAEDGISAAYDPSMPLLAPLVVNAVSTVGPKGTRLTAHWMYAGELLAESQVVELAQLWCTTLRAFAEHAAGPGAGGHTPSDMPLVSLSQNQLDALEAKWRKKA